MFAAKNGHVECARTLLEGGASADLLTPMGTALHAAAQHGHTETAALLLSVTDNALVNVTRSCDCVSVLHLAALSGHLELFRQLCQHGSRLDAKTAEGFTVLHMAAQEGHEEIVEFVLDQDMVKIDARRKLGLTALMDAAVKGHVKVAKLLLKAGADACASSDNGQTTLHFAAYSGSLETLELFIQLKRRSINGQNDRGLTPIMKASMHGWAQAVQALIYAGASVHKTDEDQNTCLHLAASCGHADVIGAILSSSKLSSDVLRWDLFTPLHLAVYRGHAEAVKMLLSFGADGASPVCGKTPLEWARHKGHADVARVLERHLEVNKTSSWVKDLPEGDGEK